jgi:hypothetical protein
VVTLSAFPQPATHVFIDVQGGAVMVTFDGSDPSSVNGHLYSPGDCAMWSKATAAAARFIRQGATDGAVQCSPMA